MLKDFRLRLRALLLRKRVENELDEELSFHIAMQEQKNQRLGETPDEAHRHARMQFGSIDRFAEECRDERGVSTLDVLARDLRYARRMLRKSPSFTTVAVITLALAIGANAVVFGIMNTVILHPLNLQETDSLYGIEWGKSVSMGQSYPDYLDLRDRNHSFDGLAAYGIAQARFDEGQGSVRAWGIEASGNYFDVLRIQPYLGRLFRASDEHGPNSAPLLVLSYAYWHTHFHDDPGVIGRTVIPTGFS